MFSTDKIFDVAIIGGGVGGSLLAAILARHGVKVLQVEAGTHPRFTIGESTVPETSFGLRVLARRYDVPEIENLATHGALRRNVSPACGIKRNFSFAYHREGEPMRPSECNQIPTFGPPLGPDAHYFRQDVDAYLTYVALSYGAKLLTQTMISDVQFDADGVTLRTTTAGDFRASYLVDAGGIRAMLPERLGLRQDPPYKLRSRSTFTHMVDVRPFDEVAPPRSEHMLPSPFSQGTLHHIFPGGWIWVIPFDNHATSTNSLCSVGLSLNLDRFPSVDGESPEQEFWRIIRRFPSIAHQFRFARAARPFVASSRNQFSSRQIVGDRWCLLPHASDFIDPLFSSGLAVTVCALNALGHRLIDAVRERDFSTERFTYLESWTKRMFRYYDDLVVSAYASFDEFELWNAWMRVWLIGTLYGANAQQQAAVAFQETGDPGVFMQLEQEPYRGLQGIDNPHYAAIFDEGVRMFDAYRKGDGRRSDEIAARLFELLEGSGLCPDTWDVLNARNRCPSGVFTLVPLAKTLYWGMHRSPPHVRGQYFTGGFRFVLKEAVQLYGRELANSAITAHQYLRDMFLNWNHDWRARPQPRRLRATPPIVTQRAEPVREQAVSTIQAAE